MASAKAAKNDLVQSVQRASQILRLLSIERRPMTVREIATVMGLNPATCHHLVNTLESEGLLDFNGACRLGPRIGELHDAFEAMLAPDPALVDLLDELRRRLAETCYLGRWDGDEVVSVAVREGGGGVQVRGVHLGYRTHTYARALGRALLAYRDDDFIAEYLRTTRLEALTPHTTISAAQLRKLLTGVRRQGVAIEREELTEGICCVAAPVFNRTGSAVAAFSVSVPSRRFERAEERIVEVVREIAKVATVRLDGEKVK